ncbi:NAD(P)H oxidoreductase [Prosthecochloris sp. GSB1]|uniref:NAD(P)H-dependent oxidoreductase n=1 Tax=Prosthecochloris sp. GSB1 TaxID=281093 RepID=UPI000B8CCE45|nr:NAD(P)H-dependent oxidoreductase [Prosthecochloris sp. GSB1]ASQ89607.1 NAD(P)H oxidoreductase [Prosthecochloris sp. GSB1]
MRKILIVFAHPAFEKSRVNRALVGALADLDGVTLHDLYERYPEMDVDVKAEQRLLEANDIVILQYPFFLYGMPALLKEWMDLVLVHGWAFGSRGRAMRGKWFCPVITTGGGRLSYAREGFNRFSIRELLAPLEQTAHLCGMRYLPPFAIHGTNVMKPDAVREHASRYRRMLKLLADDAFDPAALEKLDYLDDRMTEKQ